MPSKEHPGGIQGQPPSTSTASWPTLGTWMCPHMGSGTSPYQRQTTPKSRAASPVPMHVPRPPSRCPEPSTVPTQTLGEALTQPMSELTERFPRQQITSIRLGGSDRFQPGSDIGSLNFLRGWERARGTPTPSPCRERSPVCPRPVWHRAELAGVGLAQEPGRGPAREPSEGLGAMGCSRVSPRQPQPQHGPVPPNTQTGREGGEE